MDLFRRTVTPCQKVAYPITYKDFILEQALLKEYECPVCINYASPPIMMCTNSHVICFDCWKRCVNCPTCRAPKSISRAFCLEKIHPYISFRCKWEGCPYQATASYTGTHEYQCKYFPLKCPLGDSHQCTWMGTMENVQEHLRSCHKDNVYFQPNVFLRSTNLRTALQKSYTIIFVVNDRLFKFCWKFDTSVSTEVKFSMVSIGNGNPVNVYSYTVVFSKWFPKNLDYKRTYFKSQIRRSYNDCSVINRDPILARQDRTLIVEMKYVDLVRECDRSGTLIYQVIIELNPTARPSNGFNRCGGI